MGNLDFTNYGLFSWYCVMLALAGLTGLGASLRPNLKVAARILLAAVGLATLGYAYDLVYLFHGGTYTIAFKVFLLPVFLLAGAIRALATRRDAKRAPKQRAAREDAWAAESAWYAQRQAQAATAAAAQSTVEPAATEPAARDTPEPAAAQSPSAE